MLRAEHALLALQRPAVERQGPDRVAKRIQAIRQIVHAGERVRMLRTEHALAALQRPAEERQGPACVTKRMQAILPDCSRW